MRQNRLVFWTKGASARHDETAWDIALQYGEQAAYTYLDGIDEAIGLIRENPRIGRNLFPHLPNRHRHVTGKGWEIVYDDDESGGQLVVLLERQKCSSTTEIELGHNWAIFYAQRNLFVPIKQE